MLTQGDSGFIVLQVKLWHVPDKTSYIIEVDPLANAHKARLGYLLGVPKNPSHERTVTVKWELPFPRAWNLTGCPVKGVKQETELLYFW